MAEAHAVDTKNFLYKQNLKKIGYLSASTDSQWYLDSERAAGTAIFGCVEHALQTLVLTDHPLPGDERPMDRTAVMFPLTAGTPRELAAPFTVGRRPPGCKARDELQARPYVGNALADGVAVWVALHIQVFPNEANTLKERCGHLRLIHKRIVAMYLDRNQDCLARAKHSMAHMNSDLVVDEETRKECFQRLGEHHGLAWQGDQVVCGKCQHLLIVRSAMRWVPQQCTLISLSASSDVQVLGPAKKLRQDQTPLIQKQHAHAHVAGRTGLEGPDEYLLKKKQHAQALVAGLAGPERPDQIPPKEKQHANALVAGRTGPERPDVNHILEKQHAYVHGAGLTGPREKLCMEISLRPEPYVQSPCVGDGVFNGTHALLALRGLFLCSMQFIRQFRPAVDRDSVNPVRMSRTDYGWPSVQ